MTAIAAAARPRQPIDRAAAGRRRLPSPAPAAAAPAPALCAVIDSFAPDLISPGKISGAPIGAMRTGVEPGGAGRFHIRFQLNR